MKSPNGIFLAIVVCAVLAVAVFFLSDLGADKVYASPEEVFNASRVAIQKKDLRAWCRCLTDESRDLILANDVVVLVKEELEKSPTKEHTAVTRAKVDVQAKHGLTEEHLAKFKDEYLELKQRQAPLEAELRFAQKLLAPVSDRNALFAELFRATYSDAKNPLAGWADAKLSEVKISGNIAEGSVGSPQGSAPMTFRKQGEGWRIDIIGPAEKRPAPKQGFHQQ